MKLVGEEETSDTHAHIALARAIRNLLVEDWTVEFCHIYRNKCADKLAKLEHSLPLRLSFFDNLSAYVYPLSS